MSGSLIGGVVGGIFVAGLLLLFVVILFVVFAMRRRRKYDSVTINDQSAINNVVYGMFIKGRD